MSLPENGSPATPSEWWESVTIPDVASCKQRLTEFLDGKDSTDTGSIQGAFALFIVCGGDLVWLGKYLEERSLRVFAETKARRDTDHIASAEFLDDWERRLKLIMAAVPMLRGAYDKNAGWLSLVKWITNDIHKCSIARIRILSKNAPRPGPRN